MLAVRSSSVICFWRSLRNKLYLNSYQVCCLKPLVCVKFIFCAECFQDFVVFVFDYIYSLINWYLDLGLYSKTSPNGHLWVANPLHNGHILISRQQL